MVVLAACTTTQPTTPDAMFMVQPGSVGEAEVEIWSAVCRWEIRCNPGPDPATCPTQPVTLINVERYCAQNDCAAPYAGFTQLNACIANYDAMTCAGPVPPQACPL